jgi:hypothetical protein
MAGWQVPRRYPHDAGKSLEVSVVKLAIELMSPVGTIRTSNDVRSLVANRRKADMTLTAHFGSE